jgi:hypothetical protein
VRVVVMSSEFKYFICKFSRPRPLPEDARAAAAEILKINPKFSLERYAKTLPFTRPAADRIVEDLRKAGLK